MINVGGNKVHPLEVERVIRGSRRGGRRRGSSARARRSPVNSWPARSSRCAGRDPARGRGRRIGQCLGAARPTTPSPDQLGRTASPCPTRARPPRGPAMNGQPESLPAMCSSAAAAAGWARRSSRACSGPATRSARSAAGPPRSSRPGRRITGSCFARPTPRPQLDRRIPRRGRGGTRRPLRPDQLRGRRGRRRAGDDAPGADRLGRSINLTGTLHLTRRVAAADAHCRHRRGRSSISRRSSGCGATAAWRPTPHQGRHGRDDPGPGTRAGRPADPGQLHRPGLPRDRDDPRARPAAARPDRAPDPPGTPGDPDDVTGPVLFLLSDAAASSRARCSSSTGASPAEGPAALPPTTPALPARLGPDPLQRASNPP